MTKLPRPDLPHRHPQNIPLSQWPQAWIVLEVSVLLDDDYYMVLSSSERENNNYPVTRDEMIKYIIENGKIPAAGI